jgi:hypothetical protein
LGAFFAAGFGDALTAFFADFLGAEETLDFLPTEERMILAMIGVY